MDGRGWLAGCRAGVECREGGERAARVDTAGATRHSTLRGPAFVAVVFLLQERARTIKRCVLCLQLLFPFSQLWLETRHMSKRTANLRSAPKRSRPNLPV